MQTDTTPLAACHRGLHPTHSAVTPGVGCHRELSEVQNLGARGRAGEFRPGLPGSRAPVFNLGSPFWEKGVEARSFMEGIKGLPLTL